MTEIIGHQRRISYLNRLMKSGRLAHAYLFYGPEHVGKLTIAKEFGAALLCRAREQRIGNACGECHDCRMAAQGSHSQIVLLDPDHPMIAKKEKRKEISIADIRELKRMFALSPSLGTWRLAIINEADKMSSEAANAFLKLLEEPGLQTVFILIAEDRENILPTILSRCQHLNFSCVSDKELRSMPQIKNMNAAEVEDVLCISAGRPGLFISLAEDAKVRTEELELDRAVSSMLDSRDIAQAFQLSDGASDSAEARTRLFHHLMVQLRKRLIADAGLRTPALIRNIKRTARIASLLENTNANVRLGLDAMMLEFVD